MITTQKQRPEKPDSIPPAIWNHMQLWWHQDPSMRPDFQQILTFLESYLLNMRSLPPTPRGSSSDLRSSNEDLRPLDSLEIQSLKKKNLAAAQFWEMNFDNRIEVIWELFFDCLENAIQKEYQTTNYVLDRYALQHDFDSSSKGMSLKLFVLQTEEHTSLVDAFSEYIVTKSKTAFHINELDKHNQEAADFWKSKFPGALTTDSPVEFPEWGVFLFALNKVFKKKSIPLDREKIRRALDPSFQESKVSPLMFYEFAKQGKSLMVFADVEGSKNSSGNQGDTNFENPVSPILVLKSPENKPTQLYLSPLSSHNTSIESSKRVDYVSSSVPRFSQIEVNQTLLPDPKMIFNQQSVQVLVNSLNGVLGMSVQNSTDIQQIAQGMGSILSQTAAIPHIRGATMKKQMQLEPNMRMNFDSELARNVISELEEKERSFNIFLSTWSAELLNLSASDPDLLDSTSVEILLSDISRIVNVSRSLEMGLVKALTHENFEMVTIAVESLKKNIGGLEYYFSYMNKNETRLEIREKLKISPKFTKFLQTRNAALNRTTLAEFLAAPIQHLLHYPLHISRLAKSFPTTNKYWSELDGLLKVFNSFASILDLTQLQVSNTKRMFAVQTTVKNCPSIVRPYDCFYVGEFPITYCSNNKPGYVFMFSDQLLFTEIVNPSVPSSVAQISGQIGEFVDQRGNLANLENLNYKTTIKFGNSILRDCNDYEGSVHRDPSHPFTFTFDNEMDPRTLQLIESSNPKHPHKVVGRFRMGQEEGVEFCIAFRSTRRKWSHYNDLTVGLNNFSESLSYQVFEDFLPRIMQELYLRAGEKVILQHRFPGTNWGQGKSEASSRYGVFPLSILSPVSRASQNNEKKGIYTVHRNPSHSPIWTTSPTGIHPLHLKLEVGDQLLIQRHFIGNHLLVYGLKIDGSDEGWFSIVNTISGSFRVRGVCQCSVIEGGENYQQGDNSFVNPVTPRKYEFQSLRLNVGEIVDVRAIYGISNVHAKARTADGSCFLVRIGVLSKLEPLT
ncbi:hypothetical protein HK098_003932 [Nowakowskiella sp. JEL0407]|nr:hypothetical protein HK098_003932 [Nowakowskiella sp. JEL0407]